MVVNSELSLHNARSMSTEESISAIITPSLCGNEKVYNEYIERLKEGLLTRDENPGSHFGAYFLPYNPRTKEVFLVHHKKAGMWISPGGHIDEGEAVFTALNREISEELGIKNFFKDIPTPFLMTITPIHNAVQACRKHYDVWYLMTTDGSDFKIDKEEFLNTKWLTLAEAKNLTKDVANSKAIEILENNQ